EPHRTSKSTSFSSAPSVIQQTATMPSLLQTPELLHLRQRISSDPPRTVQPFQLRTMNVIPVGSRSAAGVKLRPKMFLKVAINTVSSLEQFPKVFDSLSTDFKS
ncbi:hypothetical protein AMECASPLE_023225, partial [Ameca splendens]